MNAERLGEAMDFHDKAPQTTSYGGALVILYKGHVVGESYTTGNEGGPQPWTVETCNDMKSSTKSVFGTAVGVFLDEFRERVDLDTYLVGSSRRDSLIPQIWDQPLTDERKQRIKVKHVISMTSGHESREPWVPATSRHLYPGYENPFQMYEYCFGWWYFDDIPSHHKLKFEPGTDFNYSNTGSSSWPSRCGISRGRRSAPTSTIEFSVTWGCPSKFATTSSATCPTATTKS